jgi:hypothetical protein
MSSSTWAQPRTIQGAMKVASSPTAATISAFGRVFAWNRPKSRLFGSPFSAQYQAGSVSMPSATAQTVTTSVRSKMPIGKSRNSQATSFQVLACLSHAHSRSKMRPWGIGR